MSYNPKANNSVAPQQHQGNSHSIQKETLPLASTIIDSRETTSYTTQLQRIMHNSSVHQQNLQLSSYIKESRRKHSDQVELPTPLQQKPTRDATQKPIQKQSYPATANKTGLPDQLKSGIENLSGMSLDNVKVHYNSDKPAQLNAYAYAQGSDIHLAPGQEKHLPHEAWHVVQQAQGRVKPTMQMKGGMPVNDDAGLEKEADIMGEKAYQHGVAQLQRTEPAATTSPTGTPVVQKSSIGEDTDEASPDQQMANVLVSNAESQIARLRSGNGEAMDTTEEVIDSLDTTDRSNKEHQGILLKLDRFDGQGVQELYMAESTRAALHRAAQENRWNYKYSIGGVEYLGQYRSPIQFAKTIQRAATVTGALTPGAAKTPYTGPFTFGTAAAPNNYGVNGKNVSQGAYGNSMRRQPKGSGVGKTRPTDWAKFIGMTASNPFKQGHQMHHLLGGHGVHNNLAPFTGSLNGLHYHRVETLVIDQTRSGGSDQYADYSTVPTFGGNASIAGECILRFDGMTTTKKLAAMVAAGIITAPAAAAINAANPLPAPEQGLAHTWITSYVTAAFPDSITCTVRFIDYAAPTGGALTPTITATAPQTVTITNRT